MTDFDINSDPKTWTTRDGRKVVIYCTDAPGYWPIHELIEGMERAVSWIKEGGYYSSNVPSPHDLISPRKTVKVDFWVNVYPEGVGEQTWRTKQIADAEADKKIRIACKHIVMEVEEGEFDG